MVLISDGFVVFKDYHNPVVTYKQLIYPQPATTHANYPLFTSGGGDSRWNDLDEIEENGLHWVGALMQALVSLSCLRNSHELPFVIGLLPNLSVRLETPTMRGISMHPLPGMTSGPLLLGWMK